MRNPALYLIPVLLGDTAVEKVIPEYNIYVVSQLKYFIVENVALQGVFFEKKCDPGIDVDSLAFYELNKHTDKRLLSGYLSPMKSGESIGVIPKQDVPPWQIRVPMLWLLPSRKDTG